MTSGTHQCTGHDESCPDGQGKYGRPNAPSLLLNERSGFFDHQDLGVEKFELGVFHRRGEVVLSQASDLEDRVTAWKEDWQPIFYPVWTEDYAIRIARDWNTNDEENGNVGYVTAFNVDTDYLDRFQVQDVGGRELQEYWIPAEDLDEFNSHIVGPIQVLSEWRGTPPVRVR